MTTSDPRNPRASHLLWAGLALLAAACLGPRPPLPPTMPPEGEEIPVVSTGAAASILWAIPDRTDPLPVAEALTARPHLRLTALLPERFFGEDEDSKQAKLLFSGLVSRGQVEVLLTLPGRPVLALLHDSDLARASVTGQLPPRFQWSEDAMGQVALAKSAYRRRWRMSPGGMSIPWGAVAGPELEPLAKVGLHWLYMERDMEPGFYAAGRLTAVAAAPFPLKADASRKAWFRRLFSMHDDRLVAPIPIRISTLEELDALAALSTEGRAWLGGGVQWTPVGPLLKELSPEDDDLPALPPSDLSRWIGESDENRAWQLLSIARKALEDFKNSGRADVRTLDMATREIYSAEGGGVFLVLGSDGNPGRAAEAKRSFLASLEQTFRLLGAPPPPALRQGFSGGPLSDGAQGSEHPFFRKEGSALVWRDNSGDDRGPGDLFYPTGSGFPTGSWDLSYFRVEARATEVVFRWGLAALPGPGAPGLALVDTYIDINRLPGAGADALLPGRPGLVEPANAWEYALSVDGWGARLYQPWTGSGPRRVAVLTPRVIPPSTIEVSVPRKHLRGDPADWGFAVAVMGRQPSAAEASEEPSPMKVSEQPGPDHFGGAAAGRRAPPFVDLLSEDSVQDEALGAYKQGRDVVLPFVRAE